MIKYQEKIQNFYKMRDTLIAEGYNDNESIVLYDEVELREIALQIIIDKCSPLLKQYLLDLLPKEERDLLKEVLI